MMYSARHRAVVYPYEQAQGALRVLPDARRVGDLVAVPATMPNIQLLAFLELPVPSLIDLEYDWPIKPGLKPMDHQRRMAAFMSTTPRCFNLSEMGTGKTLATLWAADYLMTKGVIKRALIVAPLSILDRAWADEIFVHLMGRRRAVILHDQRAQTRLDRLREDADFYIINHDGLAVGMQQRPGRGVTLGPLAEAIRARADIDCVIVDEASAYKEYTTRRSRIIRTVAAQKPYLWALSGTPTPNAPTDAWALKKLVTPGYIENFHMFRERTMLRITNFKWAPRRDATETVHKTLQPAIRYDRAECIDLPECLLETRDVELSSEQKALYADLRKKAIADLNSGAQITAVNEAVLRMKLIQVACGAIYDGEHNAHIVDTAPRIKILREVIEEAAGKILVFAPLTSVVDMLYTKLSVDFSVEKITGQVSAKNRSDIFRRFETEKEPRIIVADPGTMAHGVTLVAANTIVWYGPTDRPEIYDQANARINRPGQKRNMLIVQLAATQTEREIFRRLHEKTSLQGAILNLVKEGR